MNLLYFSLFFSIVLGGSLFRLSTIQAPLSFFFCACLEAFLETIVLLLITRYLSQSTPRWVFRGWISLSFILLLAHGVDLMTLRLMDQSILYPIRYFFGPSFHHFFVACRSLNLNAQFGFFLGFLLLLLPIGGWFLYRFTAFLGKRWQRDVSLKNGLTAFLIGVCGLCAMNYWRSLKASSYLQERYQKSLPLNVEGIFSSLPTISLLAPLAPPPQEREMQEKLSQIQVSLSYKPNIYLFVVETLRKDFVNAETAPFLSTFAQENISFSQSFANANATHLSWFSIFHSLFPHHWTSIQTSWKEGSIPLQILQKIGYSIHVYSSADLRLFEMDSLLFGSKRKLLSHGEEYSQNSELNPAERDQMAFEALHRDLQYTSGHLFIVFLDATHSEYSIPKEFSPKFLPIVDRINYLKLSPETIQPIKNRYRNSIFFIDSLFGQFFHQLKERGLYEEALIAITGDHGEEFFEEGALFHGTHLNKYQTSVPLFLRLGNQQKAVENCSHVDLFPSLLHHLTGIDLGKDLLDGKSVLIKEKQERFHLAVANNGFETPSEFLLSQGERTTRIRCPKGKNIYETLDWEVLADY